MCNRIRIKKDSIRIIEECLSEKLSNKEKSFNPNLSEKLSNKEKSFNQNK